MIVISLLLFECENGFGVKEIVEEGTTSCHITILLKETRFSLTPLGSCCN